MRGEGAEAFQNEAGVHRLQRVPTNERRGRVHSSTVTVAVLDSGSVSSPTTSKCLDPDDLIVEWYSGSGAGGQHRNKHMNSARVTHRPSGLVRTAQTRSRANSFQEACAALEQALRTQAQAADREMKQALRHAQWGEGSHRSDRQRIWAFQRDRVDDLRTGRHLRVQDALAGRMDRLWPSEHEKA